MLRIQGCFPWCRETFPTVEKHGGESVRALALFRWRFASLIDEGVTFKKQKHFWTCRDSSENHVEVPAAFQRYGSQDLLGQQCLHSPWHRP